MEFLYRKHPVGVAETLAKFINDGAVELYYNNNKKFETISTGCSITGELRVSGDITAFYTSDSNLKTNIKTIDDPLEKVLSLHGYTFDWNEESGKQGSETGVIAQEVEAAQDFQELSQQEIMDTWQLIMKNLFRFFWDQLEILNLCLINKMKKLKY